MATRARNSWIRKHLKRFYYLTRPGPKRFRYFGCEVHFPPGSHLFQRVCEENVYEPANLRVIRRFIRAGSTFFDIGANLGLIALPILRECPGCNVVSFEPSPGILPFLRRTQSESSFASRWKLVEEALGAVPGEAEFFTAGAGLSAFDGLRNTARKGERHSVRVKVSTLDDHWTALGEPEVSVVKIDVEGGEADVLRGAERLVTALQPAILVEWNPTNLAAYDCRPEWLLDWAVHHSYGIHSIASGTPVGDATTLFLQGREDDNFLLVPRRQNG